MERMRLHLIDEWLRRGIEVDLVMTSRRGPLINKIPPGATVFEIAPRSPIFFPIGLINYIRSRKPSHILAAGPDINALTLLVARFFARNVPVSVSFHNHLSSELRMAQGLLAAKEWVTVRILRQVLRRCVGVVAVSHGVAEDLKTFFPAQKEKIAVIYNPVVTADFREKAYMEPEIRLLPEGTPYIIYAGRLTYSKGIDVLLDAYATLASRTDAHLVIMGGGPCEKNVEKEKKRNHGHKIHLLPYQENPLPWIRNADVLVLPSRHEGLANVIIEALACGTQVVASDCPSGPAEILGEGRFGQLVPVGNSKALADALLRSLKGEFWVDPEELIARGSTFSAQRAAEEYISVLTASKVSED